MACHRIVIMIFLIWFLFQITLQLSCMFMNIIVKPTTYVGEFCLNCFITAIILLAFIFIWKTKLEIKERDTLKSYLSYILLGVGICLFHRIIFVIFPQIAMSFYIQVGAEYYNSSLYVYKNPVTFLYISIVGPILEELFYRGKILDAYLKKYKPIYAVVITSILFAVSHMNAVQFISGLCLGLLCGYIYVKKKDVKAPIIIHVANNLYSSIMTLQIESYETYRISEYRMISSIIIGLVLMLFGFYIFRKETARFPEKNRNISLKKISADK